MCDFETSCDALIARCGMRRSRSGSQIGCGDDMRKRGLPSPDRADAMAIAFAGRANAAPMSAESDAGALPGI